MTPHTPADHPRQLGGTELKRLHRTWKRRPHARLALLLDNVAGPFNVGAIVRTSAAFNVDHIYLTGETPEFENPKVQKTALGTHRYLESSQHDNAVAAIRAARAAGYTIIGLELATHAVPLTAMDLAGDICLVLGHEDRGISASTLKACDAAVFIPQLGKVGSLNVASAAAIGCYEVRRHMWHARDEQ